MTGPSPSPFQIPFSSSDLNLSDRISHHFQNHRHKFVTSTSSFDQKQNTIVSLVVGTDSISFSFRSYIPPLRESSNVFFSIFIYYSSKSHSFASFCSRFILTPCKSFSSVSSLFQRLWVLFTQKLFINCSRKMTVETRVDEPRGQFPVGMRVLAVDDDPTCLLVLETLLRRCQYHSLLPMLLMPFSFTLKLKDLCFHVLCFSRFCDSVSVSMKRKKKESISSYVQNVLCK